MIILYYIKLLIPLILLFSVGYFLIILIDRLLRKNEIFQIFDLVIILVSISGFILSFIAYGVLDINRFAFVSEKTKSDWYVSGFNYEMLQSLFSGLFVSILVVCINRIKIAKRIRQILLCILVFISTFILFGFWPSLISFFS
jgi:hypothetical protein